MAMKYQKDRLPERAEGEDVVRQGHRVLAKRGRKGGRKASQRSALSQSRYAEMAGGANAACVDSQGNRDAREDRVHPHEFPLIVAIEESTRRRASQSRTIIICHSSSVPIVNHAAMCGSGTPICCKMPANASGPFDNLAKPCSMKP